MREGGRGEDPCIAALLESSGSDFARSKAAELPSWPRGDLYSTDDEEEKEEPVSGIAVEVLW